MTDTHSYSGACHCGALTLTYRTALEPSSWMVRACQCEFCRAHNVRTTSDPQGKLEFAVRDRGRLSLYRFGVRTADFLVCRECGVYVGAYIETPRGGFGIMNINALQPIPKDLLEALPMEYGSETKDERIARREQRWSPASLDLG